MKKIILLFTAVCASVSMVFAQGQVSQAKVDVAPSDKYTPSTAPVTTSNKNRGVGDAFPSTLGTKHVVGKTTYDLQTNGALQNRLMVLGTNIHAAWTMSQETGVTATSSYADRGTGYNFYNGTAWGAPPSTRMEGAAGIRTGFGAMGVNGNGNLIYVSHSAAYNIMLSERVAGTWNTATTTLSNTSTAIWPDVATSGNWMYVIAASQDSLTKSNGIRNGYFFSRSNDNGATWIDNMIPMPLIDSVGHYRGGGNSYSISARDSVVAIVFGDFGTDLTMLRSNDYGATWTKKIVWDFPIDNYNPVNMTDTNNDNVQDTIYTIDGSLDIALDKTGAAHVAFASFRFFNDGPATAGYNFYAQFSRMNYYNSTVDSVSVADYFLFVDPTSIVLHHTLCDLDTLLTPIANYTTSPGGASYNTISYVTMPQVSVNENNNDVYITYSCIADGDQTEIDLAHPFWLGITGIDGQPNRDIMVLASNNGGASFGIPVNISRTRHYEEVFPSVPERITGTDLHVLYQGDIEPGTIMQNDDAYDSDFENWMIYQKVAIADIFTKSLDLDAPCNQFELPLAVSNVALINGNINIYPNPAVETITVELNLNTVANQVSYELYDMTGRMISKVTRKNVTTDKTQINVQTLTSGNYILKVNADNAISSHKVSIK